METTTSEIAGPSRPPVPGVPLVAIVGTRYVDLTIEQDLLGPAGVKVQRASGADVTADPTVGRADVIIAGTGIRFDRDLLERLSARAIVRAGIGVDSVDLAAAAALGVQVANVPDYATEAVAQHALAVALAGCRRLIEADRAVRAGRWSFDDLRPVHIPSSQTAGVLGLGRIGRQVAELFRAVGFGRVVGHDPVAVGDGVELVAFEELLEISDVVSLHVPGSDQPLLGSRELARMREHSVLVNTARGSLVDIEALAAGLARGRPRVACLDVFPAEPPDLSVFEAVADRLILSPHQAWYSVESEADLRRKSAEEALRIIRREPPLHPVNHPEVAR